MSFFSKKHSKQQFNLINQTLSSVKVSLYHKGKGPKIVIIPSMLVSLSAYKKLAQSLSSFFEVYIIEMPGSGKSSRVHSPLSFENYADFLANTFDVLKIPKATVITHSNSGAVGIWFAKKYPEKVCQLILADSIGGARSSMIQILLRRSFDALLEPILSLKRGYILFYNLFRHFRNFINQIKLAANTEILEEAREIKAPVLLAWGQGDYTLPASSVTNFVCNIENPFVYFCQKGSHDWLITNPSEFSGVVVNFCVESFSFNSEMIDQKATSQSETMTELSA